MSIGITIDVLPALRGDCLWIECTRANNRPWRLLIDGGMPGTWPVLRERVANLAKVEPAFFDLAVVSHIDSDHMGGMLPLFASTDPRVTFGDIWFNGLPQLPEPGSSRSRSVAEGERLVDILSGQGGGPLLPWNDRFGREAAMTKGDGAYLEIIYADGPTLTLLSPTPRRLESLRRVWTNELLRLQRGEPSELPSATVPLPLENLKPWQRSRPRGTIRLPTAAASHFSLRMRVEVACWRRTPSPRSSATPSRRLPMPATGGQSRSICLSFRTTVARVTSRPAC